MAKRVIGILTSCDGKRFGQPGFFRSLIEKGRQLGAIVFLFSPKDVDEERRQINGYIPSGSGGWERQWFPWPDIVIDYYRFYPLPKHQHYLQFRKKPLFSYVNSRFSNKWTVHQVLWNYVEMRKWLPETVEFSPEELDRMSSRHAVIYIKPSNGTAGRSILRIKQQEDGYYLLGRDKQNEKIVARIKDTSSFSAWIEQWVKEQKLKKETFLIQQGLDLALIPNRTVDHRLLIQKNDVGAWSITGIGTRIGAEKSSTSNLHGGGKAVRTSKFLSSIYGQETALRIMHECRELAHSTANVVEDNFGRMMELGLDIGVDTEGRVWLIEINPKPGRDIFKHLRRLDLYEKAVTNPLRYALYVCK